MSNPLNNAEIIKNQNELAAIIENVSDGICIFDKSGQYIIFNKSARNIFFPNNQSLSKLTDAYKQPCFYGIYGENIEPANNPTQMIMRGEQFKERKMTVRLSHEILDINVSGTPIYDENGIFSLGVLSIRDTTDSRRHEEAIKRRFEILNRVVDTFDLPLIRLSCPNLKIIDINKKAYSAIKLINSNITSIDQIKDNKLYNLFGKLKTIEYYQCMREALEEKKTKYLYALKNLINGIVIYWNVIFEPVLEVNGEVQELLILIVDVTPEIKSVKVMENELKMQGEFLVNISHELKTPLNVIFATAQLFSMYCTTDTLDKNKASIIKYIDCIKQNSYRLSKMINNIVDLSKIEAGFFKLKLTNNDIVKFVEDIVMSVTNFTDSKGLNIVFDTNLEEKIIAIDTEKIERVVLNLISNAIKFTDKGDEIVVSVIDNDKFIDISVRDNGIGIEDKYLDIIFDRFKQVDKSLSRNAEGTGIGLSLVKSIVELHDGNIHVKSKFGKGSNFIVTLPSVNVLKDDPLYNSEVRSMDQNILVELSDVYS
ncbi:PAS domain-containing sensor histidine kinase [Clostridium psychrophilum]|uniref:PAS domain-containing sensor histidine kinase n=1 Tax=Clostridium psychrophilum TaxID=132926 RepID=UPI001FE58CEA|nr:PAS domain-containing sensor histidine kinase [Clostridium psychrophilum]